MKLKRLKKALIIISAVLVSIIGSKIIVEALIDESNSVKIDAESIEDSTLVIGTHLIHISAMSDSLYSVAQLSADESAQYNMYYKSELANGTWYDITNAFSLDDITTGGIPVESKVIEELNGNCHKEGFEGSQGGKTISDLVGDIDEKIVKKANDMNYKIDQAHKDVFKEIKDYCKKIEDYIKQKI